jgi:photosystem II stability/assembly factor-like uncharacterized protein
MKAKFGAIVTDGRGKLGGSVFSKNRYGLYEKSKVTPINTPSAYKSIIKNNHKTVVSAWSNLTDAERQSWNSGTYNFPQKNTFSDTCYLSGYALFLKLNLNRLILSQSLINVCPVKYLSVNIVSINISIRNDIPFLYISFSPNIPAGFAYKLYATASLSPGINYSNRRFKLIGIIQPTSSSTIDITSIYNSRYGSIGSTGQKIFIKLIPVEIASGIEMQSLSATGFIKNINNFSIGLNWYTVAQLDSGGFIYSLCDVGNGIVLAGTGIGGHMYRSTDYGNTWSVGTKPANESAFYSMINLGNGIIIAGTWLLGHILRSTDYGQTWSDMGQKFTQTRIYSLCYLGNGIVLAGTYANGKILRSTDYGLTWSDLGTQFTQTGIFSLCYLGNGIVLAGTSANGKILRSTDYGLTWSDLGSQFTQTAIYSLCYLGNGIVLAGSSANGKILRSTDYGLTWSDLGQMFGATTINTIVYTTNNIIIAGTSANGKILRSTDNGLSWNDLGTQANSASVTSLLYFPNGVMLAGLGNNTFLRKSLFN